MYHTDAEKLIARARADRDAREYKWDVYHFWIAAVLFCLVFWACAIGGVWAVVGVLW